MLALAFFVSVFSTVTWLIYAFLFVSEKLSGIPLNALSLFDASIYAAFMIFSGIFTIVSYAKAKVQNNLMKVDLVAKIMMCQMPLKHNQ